MKREAGFTLLEIMVALVVFGSLMIGLTQGAHFGLQAWNGQSRSIARRCDLDATDRTLRDLIGQIDSGFRVDAPNIVGLADGFAFTTRMPLGAAAGLSRNADVLLTVDPAHDFILRWASHLLAIWLAGRRVDTWLSCCSGSRRSISHIEGPPEPSAGSALGTGGYLRRWFGSGLCLSSTAQRPITGRGP